MADFDWDQQCRALTQRNRNLLVPWYLMTSYLYYVKDKSVVSDRTYDDLCKRLLAEWNWIEHRHKDLIDREALAAGTGYYIKESDYPLIVKSAAERMLSGGEN